MSTFKRGLLFLVFPHNYFLCLTHPLQILPFTFLLSYLSARIFLSILIFPTNKCTYSIVLSDLSTTKLGFPSHSTPRLCQVVHSL
ncbi:unnamed protein product [Meloidogyne enterolobii]|uniref:Uncharacterized protein n=1 Tax=Meloidogyne enterolobii TaxID=390850 RepID=A0ACB0ZVQ6_MELEN